MFAKKELDLDVVEVGDDFIYDGKQCRCTAVKSDIIRVDILDRFGEVESQMEITKGLE